MSPTIAATPTPQPSGSTAGRPARSAGTRRFLMCPPRFFAVRYSINPWMDPSQPTDACRALAQWTALRDVFRSLGHTVEEIEPVPGLPDMVFAANGATVVDGRVLGARFRHPQRAAEGPAYLRWFTDNGYRDVRSPEHVNEGEGDFLVADGHILAGTGFRSDRRSHAEAAEFLGLPVVSLDLVDPHFYHLDTALALLSEREIMYYPEAFTPESRAVLREMFPQAVLAGRQDAMAFGLNAQSDGRHVVLNAAATGLIRELGDRGFEPIGLDVSELIKAGGGVKCCTLELRARG